MLMKAAVLFVTTLSFVCFSQTDATPETMMANVLQPTHAIIGDTIRAHCTASGIYTLPNHQWAKGAELTIGGTNGVLAVHLKPGGYAQEATWYKMPMVAGDRTGAMFDMIDTTKSTVRIDSITIFPKDQY